MGKKKELKKAAKMIRDYCHSKPTFRECGLDGCPFFDSESESCDLSGDYPIEWILKDR